MVQVGGVRVSEATRGRKMFSLNVFSRIIEYDMHHGTMIRITLESDSLGYKACSKSRIYRPHSWRGTMCVDAREAFQNAPNNGHLSEVDLIWMRYTEDWHTRTLCVHTGLFSATVSISSAVCAPVDPARHIVQLYSHLYVSAHVLLAH